MAYQSVKSLLMRWMQSIPRILQILSPCLMFSERRLSSLEAAKFEKNLFMYSVNCSLIEVYMPFSYFFRLKMIVVKLRF